MFQLNDKIYRNLEEQVLQNKEDIARHWNVDRVLADFGIKVYGRKEDPTLLPEDEGENYGAGYLVGIEAPYDVYVWTRPDPDAGQPTAYWLNIGKISIVGPQGPAGKSITNAGLTATDSLWLEFSDGSVKKVSGSLRGPQGIPGTPGVTPTITVSPISGGNRVVITSGSSVQSFVIKDGQDGQSIVGPQGKPGSFDIKGTLNTSSLLPSAASANPGDAYLVLNGDRYDLYVLLSPTDDPASYSWQNTGSLGAGTTVLVNNSPVAEFNADSKVSKLINDSLYQYLIYAQTGGSSGVTTGLTASANDTSAQVVLRSYSGGIELPQDPPIFDWMAVNKAYVDSKIGSGSSGGGLTHTQVNITKMGGQSYVYWPDYSQYLDGTLSDDPYALMIISYYDDNYDEYPYIETVTIPIPLLRDKMWSGGGVMIDSWKFYADPGGLYIYPKNNTDSPCTMIIDFYK